MQMADGRCRRVGGGIHTISHHPASAIAVRIFFCTRHEPRSSRIVCLLSRHLASCHYDPLYDLRSHTNPRNVFRALLSPSSETYCVLTISLHPHLVSSLIIFSVCLFRSMAYPILNAHFNSVSLVIKSRVWKCSKLYLTLISMHRSLFWQAVIELQPFFLCLKSNRALVPAALYQADLGHANMFPRRMQ